MLSLSPRELEVMKLLAQGKLNKEIAYELYLAHDTVKNTITHALVKLGARNRTEAYIKMGWLHIDD